jgi:hypothetical protein
MTALPIDEVLSELRATLARHRAVVLQAPPGAGKTTGVPPAAFGQMNPIRKSMRLSAVVGEGHWVSGARSVDTASLLTLNAR